MKVTIEQNRNLNDVEVIIRCHRVDTTIEALYQSIEALCQNAIASGQTKEANGKGSEIFDPKLLGSQADSIVLLNPLDIYFIEAIDHKVFIYYEKEVYESKKKLYELEGTLDSNHFFRASKSMILNINKLQSVKPLFDGRFEALLKNNEKVIISRKYVSVLKRLLNL